MQIVINIPDEQVKKSLEESKYINEDEGAKGSVHIVMLYTNAQLEFVDVERKTDFYSCEYKILPEGHGRLIDADKAIDSINKEIAKHDEMMAKYETYRNTQIPGWMWKGVCEESTIIEADKEEE